MRASPVVASPFALRLATLLMQHMQGERAFHRREDIAIWVLLVRVGPQANLAWAINESGERGRRTGKCSGAARSNGQTGAIR
jgi:hypothetical protein